jgi:poly-gamma-glutamate capsule biosynthesis protein CapA/YwtB (metallophosphatase superfamily)
MNPEELGEQTEHAHHTGQKSIGLTTAITAVLLAVATLLSHRAHTEEIKLQTKVNDQWNFYQAKHQRAHDYGRQAEIESAAGNHDLAVEFIKVAIDEECGAPLENGCQAPRTKQSPILKKLVAELNGKSTEKTDKPADAETPEPAKTEAAKPEPAKSEGGGEIAKPAKEGATREGAVKVQERARDMEKEAELITRRADHYDSAELFLEVSIVLCSIALLAENKLYWKLSFASTVVGIAIAIYGLLLN